MAQEGARVVVCDIGAASRAPAPMRSRRRRWSRRSRKAGGEAIASTLSITEPQNADAIVKAALDAFGRVDILVNNAGILRDVIFHKMSWSDWSDVIAVHLNGSFNMSRACAAHFREQNAGAFVHMTSTSGLIGNFGQANYMAAKLGIMGLSRGIALDMQRFKVRSNCIAPFAWTRMIDSIPANDRGGQAARRALPADDAGKDRAARGLSRLRPGRGHFRTDLRGAQQRDLPVQPAAPDPLAAPLRRLDAGEARSAAQGRVRPVADAARALRRRVLVGPGVTMPIVYDKLLALKIPDVERTYTAEDSILYALGVGLGRDPMDADELPFVYEKNLKLLPTFAAVLGWPGFWVRDLDTGMDWVKVVAGEQGLVLHRPLAPRGTVIGRTRVIEVIDKGAGKGALSIRSARSSTRRAAS